MKKLDAFMKNLTGHFNNQVQFDRKQAEGDFLFPFAEHLNTCCNDKIAHLPPNFTGQFMVEESYYTIKGKTHAAAHLFLFTETEEGILLTSYNLPEGIKKEAFSYAKMESVDYHQLTLSEKFVSALFTEKDGVWEGKSESLFAPGLLFKLHERFSEKGLEVSESMEKNGKRTFGYEEPLLYQRI